MKYIKGFILATAYLIVLPFGALIVAIGNFIPTILAGDAHYEIEAFTIKELEQ